MPTISGLRKRGYTPESLKKFVRTAGVAKRENIIELSLLEFCIREHLNKISPRIMAVLDPIKIIIENVNKNLTIVEKIKKFPTAYNPDYKPLLADEAMVFWNNGKGIKLSHYNLLAVSYTHLTLPTNREV